MLMRTETYSSAWSFKDCAEISKNMFLKIAFFCGLTYFDHFDFFLSVFLVWNSTRSHVTSHLQNRCRGDKPLVEPTEVPPST